MRERAEAATSGPWQVDDWKPKGGWPRIVADSGESLIGGDILVAHAYYPGADGESAEHIASWHPAVALAVVEVLEAAAAEADDLDEFDGFDPLAAIPGYAQTVALALAYLGEEVSS